jgi:hydroxymethylpyrimidine/phosphomethylpyrimidine kinase
MLGDATVVETVAAGIQGYGLGPYVLDPVMRATSGDRLLAGDALDAVRTLLVPLATLITPNLDEAELLVGGSARDAFSMKAAAEMLVRHYGAKAALIKGGHLDGEQLIDVLYVDGDVKVFSHSRIDTKHTHGTGCTLSSAITAQLALGVPLVDAVRAGLDFVHAAIQTAPGLGGGHGPLNHWA